MPSLTVWVIMNVVCKYFSQIAFLLHHLHVGTYCNTTKALKIPLGWIQVCKEMPKIIFNVWDELTC